LNNDLYSKLNSIGFRVSSNVRIKGNEVPDLELTIIEACYAVDHDSRMLGLLFSWGKIHGQYLILEKFLKYYKENIRLRGECPWVSAFCAYMVECGVLKFKKGIEKFPQEVWIGNRKEKVQLKMKGAIPYLAKLNIHVPTSYVEIREKDILNPLELLRKNPQYKNRYTYGANWRADIIFEIQKGAKNAHKISQYLKVRYPTVNSIFKEYKLLAEIQ
jgi:hypothetical protein